MGTERVSNVVIRLEMLIAASVPRLCLVPGRALSALLVLPLALPVVFSEYHCLSPHFMGEGTGWGGSRPQGRG